MKFFHIFDEIISRMVVEGIYVTLGAAQLKEKPYRKQVESFLQCDGENFVFNWALHNKPKKQFTWVYIVIGGKVRWKARFVDWDTDNEHKTFSDGRRFSSTHWMILIDFEQLPRPHELKKGFQGFRYKN